MSMPQVTLSIMVSRADLQWAELMLRHIVKTHQKSVSSAIVFVDTAPLGPAYRHREGVGTLAEIHAVVNRLRSEGIIDEVRELSYSPADRRRVYRKYFGSDLGVTHNFRGYPVLGSVYSIDASDTDFVLHFDSDMLVYQAAGVDWVQEGLRLLEERQDVMFACPRSGPPTPDGVLKQRDVAYGREEGFYSFKTFTSRKYLLSKEKLAAILPIRPQYVSGKRRAWQAITGRSALWNFEVMVTRALESSDFIRADLDNPNAWSLHTPDHGPDFVKHLPEIIEKVEAGWFPAAQAGDYDLQLRHWLPQLMAGTPTGCG